MISEQNGLRLKSSTLPICAGGAGRATCCGARCNPPAQCRRRRRAARVITAAAASIFFLWFSFLSWTVLLGAMSLVVQTLKVQRLQPSLHIAPF